MDNICPSTFLQHHVPDSRIVANQVEDLRTIPLELNDRFTVEAILDEGSQIIAIRRDIWERLGLPLMADRALVMESANSSKDPTIGLIQNLPARIGEHTFYLQVQVVQNASYEMLLGRPFLTLTQASTRHFTNGDSHLTLVDPNTQAVITVPTRPRTRTSAQQQGF